ncbi:MAG: Asp-tRNA(Asn)/Glu-tRNA(Gln) amidotransferase subunit GatB [Oscillospiraceae bacterium]|jgi:aspartyl-tRNA(Asn)/glutamyl-tRNA(Gln) amidotransferase subunit B|nr:Asp-tRNA(Asn)/Glu-tRNA(Gln) amidotransferase subunit GatB [Oscillospiraceae bacterium]
MKWEVVMGLEVHAELSTASKIFCGCSTAFGAPPNTHVCPVCSGMPGALPKLNRAVVEYAMRLGLALGCEIARDCKFDRKNYFYPDLPKAYQVSQLYAPICQGGCMDIGGKRVGIREIHMEEDAGKLIHGPWNCTSMDFNRCGVPLLEIVTLPDFRRAEEVLAYLEQLRDTLLYLGVCDCKMQEGSLRCDVNLSVRRAGDSALGVKTETKNLNSFKAIGRAIAYEAERQIERLERGGRVVQETRRWDDDQGGSYGMRSKENAQDYRYFPEPDLLPVRIDEAWLARVKNSLPELAPQKRERYVRDYGLSEYDAKLITSHKNISGLFEAVAGRSAPLEAAHLVTGEIMRLMNATSALPEDLALDPAKLAALIALVADGKINRGAYKQAVEAVYTRGVDPEEYIDANGLRMASDEDAVAKAVEAALENNPNAVADYRAGQAKAFGFLMGQVMRQLGKAGNPEAVRRMLGRRLE